MAELEQKFGSKPADSMMLSNWREIKAAANKQRHGKITNGVAVFQIIVQSDIRTGEDQWYINTLPR